MSHSIVELDHTGRVDPPVSYTHCRVIVTGGADAGKVHDVERPLIRVGSALGNDLIIRDRAVSRHHFEVRRQLGEYVLTDLGSTNGTYVGGIRVKEATIRGRTRVRIGDTHIVLEPQNEEMAVPPALEGRCGDLVGASLPMRKLYGIIERVAPTELPILVTGETGTGKEIVARAIHEKSSRRARPLLTLDCGSLPPTLIESALFGHEKGAFTGADKSYAGVFERADGGTLFLDEIGELSLDLQPKLLRALERGEIQRIRGEGTIRVDVRIIAATNRDLGEMAAEGRFRSDLYYRLAVVGLRLPALRDRKADIPALVEDFFDKYQKELDQSGARARSVHPSAMAKLIESGFPGNVRELINILRRAAVLARGDEIMPHDLPSELDDEVSPARAMLSPGGREDVEMSFKTRKATLVEAFERQYLCDLLLRNRNNVSRAARESGLARRHLQRLLEKYEIHRGMGAEDCHSP